MKTNFYKKNYKNDIKNCKYKGKISDQKFKHLSVTKEYEIYWTINIII